MSDKSLKIAQVCFALYVLIGVACFGPATVQSERARADYQERYRAEQAGDPNSLAWCPAFGPSVSDGVPKAIFWPLWLSYMAASH